MVKVICKQCKNQIDKKEALQITEEGKKRSSYFCNEFDYQLYKMDQDEKNRQLELEKVEKQKFHELDIYIASDILQYDIGQIVPPNLKKRVKKLAERYDYEVIKLCFELMKKELNYYITTKEFTNEQHLVNYIMVVIENNINDAYKIWKRKKEIQVKQEKIEELVDVDLINSSLHTNKQKTNDISMFLTEDDL